MFPDAPAGPPRVPRRRPPCRLPALARREGEADHALGGVLLAAVKHPVIPVPVPVSVWNRINDPAATGLTGRADALAYEKPNGEERAGAWAGNGSPGVCRPRLRAPCLRQRRRRRGEAAEARTCCNETCRWRAASGPLPWRRQPSAGCRTGRRREPRRTRRRKRNTTRS